MFLKIVGLSILASCAYGVVHDQITARICVEYFTIAHPRIISSESPTLLGLAWGIAATWWVGLLLGGLLGAAARLGRRPRLELHDLYRPVLFVIGGSAVIASVTGLVATYDAFSRDFFLSAWWAQQIPEEKHAAFFVVARIHLASYAAGGLLGLCASAWAVCMRFRRARGPAAQRAHVPGELRSQVK